MANGEWRMGNGEWWCFLFVWFTIRELTAFRTGALLQRLKIHPSKQVTSDHQLQLLIPHLSDNSLRNSNVMQILIVDDSALFRTMLQNVIRDLPDCHVCGTASTGEQALEVVAKLDPDIITLDVEMPGMSGIDVLRELRRRRARCRIIMVSRLTAAGAQITTDALLEGAFDFVLKPSGSVIQQNRQLLSDALAAQFAAIRQQLTDRAATPVTNSRATPPVSRVTLPTVANQPPALIVIGCSTGGPDALATLIPDLPHNLAVPVIIVQHMPSGFTHSLANRLNEASDVHVSEASDGDVLLPGKVFLAKGGLQLKLVSEANSKVVIRLTEDPPENFCRPAVDYTLRSAAALFGPRTVAVILTGMGSDGAAGCRIVHESGGYVVAQHPEGCTVYGMPRAALRTGTVHEELKLPEIAPRLAELTAPRRPGR
jgi:two-component system chemotaxis response regulator CheB